MSICHYVTVSTALAHIQLGGLLAGVLMNQLDKLSLSTEMLERRLAREKQRTIK